jgi:hypothetical protein
MKASGAGVKLVFESSIASRSVWCESRAVAVDQEAVCACEVKYCIGQRQQAHSVFSGKYAFESERS